MNQLCKVCGEPAAGYHFGAFTCEGCKSFFGRTYSNLSALGECKNNGQCVINKKNRTSCKSCRLKKCLVVGMSKSGSRYGRRSNWFKIHCLIQDQAEKANSKLDDSGSTCTSETSLNPGSSLNAGSSPGSIPSPSSPSITSEHHKSHKSQSSYYFKRKGGGGGVGVGPDSTVERLIQQHHDRNNSTRDPNCGAGRHPAITLAEQFRFPFSHHVWPHFTYNPAAAAAAAAAMSAVLFRGPMKPLSPPPALSPPPQLSPPPPPAMEEPLDLSLKEELIDP